VNPGAPGRRVVIESMEGGFMTNNLFTCWVQFTCGVCKTDQRVEMLGRHNGFRQGIGEKVPCINCNTNVEVKCITDTIIGGPFAV
jgi:hypothetical protein